MDASKWLNWVAVRPQPFWYDSGVAPAGHDTQVTVTAPCRVGALLGVLLLVQGACGGGAAGGPSGTGGAGGAGAGDAVVTPCVPGTGVEQIGAASLRDRATCLIWQRVVAATLMTNKQAGRYCDTLAQDGFSDWRVPAPEELATWPNLAVSDNAFITNPIYVPTAGTLADGCTGNSHSCNLTQYNAGALACAWQGVGFAGPTVCVRGTATAGTTAARFAAAACDACKAHLTGATADFHVADCLPYATFTGAVDGGR